MSISHVTFKIKFYLSNNENLKEFEIHGFRNHNILIFLAKNLLPFQNFSPKKYWKSIPFHFLYVYRWRTMLPAETNHYANRFFVSYQINPDKHMYKEIIWKERVSLTLPDMSIMPVSTLSKTIYTHDSGYYKTLRR